MADNWTIPVNRSFIIMDLKGLTALKMSGETTAGFLSPP